jgi:hypothetical protein
MDATSRRRLLDAVVSLRLDAAAAEATRTLEQAGLRVLLLKGPVIAAWLYDAGENRPYTDVDLLVAPGDFPEAVRVLGGIGFAPVLQPEERNSAMRHELPLRRDDVFIDLHETILGLGPDAAACFELLWSDREPTVVAGAQRWSLGLHDRTVHLALHAAANGLRDVKACEDLRRGLARLDAQTWQEAEARARSLRAVPTFTAGLRLLAEGRELADRLGLGAVLDPALLLRAASAPRGSQQLLELASTRGFRARAAFLRSELVPPAARLQLGAEPPVGLGYARAVVVRVGRVARRLRPAVVAYRQMRRAAGSAPAPPADLAG